MSSLQRNGQTRWKPSYLRRQGQMTKAQKRYFRELWPKYGIDLPYGSILDCRTIFPRPQPVLLEIGFGQGENLLHRAQLEPYNNFLAVEVHKPAIASVLHKIDQHNLCNVRLVRKDILLLLADHLKHTQFSEIWVFFPEPWLDPKDHHRRILRPFMLELLRPFVTDGTHLYFATDIQEYAYFALQTLTETEGWNNTHHADGFSTRPQWRQSSKYEKKGLKADRSIVDLCFQFQG